MAPLFALVRLQHITQQENGQFSLTDNTSGFPSLQIDPDISNHNDPYSLIENSGRNANNVHVDALTFQSDLFPFIIESRAYWSDCKRSNQKN